MLCLKSIFSIKNTQSSGSFLAFKVRKGPCIRKIRLSLILQELAAKTSLLQPFLMFLQPCLMAPAIAKATFDVTDQQQDHNQRNL